MDELSTPTASCPSEVAPPPAKRPRNNVFDLLCGICIVRMIMLHITNACNFGDEDWWSSIMKWTFFFMSFFFFKAGYFNKTVAGDSKAFCLKKTKQLMVPYLTWGCMSCALYLFFCFFILDPANWMVRALRWSHIYETSGFYGNTPLWFLFSFYCAYLGMHFMQKVRGLRWVALSFPVLSWWLYKQGNPLPMDFENVFFGIFLFFLGRVWRWMQQRLPRSSFLLLSIALTLMFVYVNTSHHAEYTMSANEWDGEFGWIFVSTLCSLCGISGVLMSLRVPRVPVLSYIGQHSMVFFVAHDPLLWFYRMVRSANVRTINQHWDDYVLLILILFGFCFFLVPYVEKVPWLSGRWPKKAAPATS